MAAERTVRVRAPAKINLTLRVLGTRPDGYHELRTVFQSLALHDIVTASAAAGPFRVSCSDPACPTDRTNLAWRAAEAVWSASGRRGAPRDATLRLTKRIPMAAGLGGGSSDGAAAMSACATLWDVDLSPTRRHAIARSLGADVPYFLEGGTALGVERGDVLFPLLDLPAAWVVLVVPGFGVSTREAYGWWDSHDAVTAFSYARGAPPPLASAPASQTRPSHWPQALLSKIEQERGPASLGNAVTDAWITRIPEGELVNDLEGPVVQHHPQIGRLVRALHRRGASYAAMSGSGSAVFGLFGTRAGASAAASVLARANRRVVVTRTLDRARFRAVARAEGVPR